MLTPETLVRHELCGLHVRVAAATDPTRVGHRGTVVSETKRTLRLDDGARVRQVPKAGATFEFALDGDEYVTVAGDRLVADPARRTEQRGESRWH